MRSSLVLAAAILWLTPVPLSAQDLSALAGRWSRDPSRGSSGPAGVSTNSTIVIALFPGDVGLRFDAWSVQLPLDGGEARVSDGRIATATVGGSQLHVTIKRSRPGGSTNVVSQTYSTTGDALTVDLALDVVRPDGTVAEMKGESRWTIVYTRAP